MKQIIQKVWKNKSNGQKAVTIPKGALIEEGDYVQIEKVDQPSKGNKNDSS